MQPGKTEISKLNFSPKHLLNLILGVLAVPANLKGLTLEANAEFEDSFELNGDSQKLTQFLWNLGNLAILNAPNKTRVRFSASVQPVTRGSESMFNLEVRVHDSHVYSPEALAKVFKSETDSSLQCSLVAQDFETIKNLNGCLCVESSESTGTVFELVLPFSGSQINSNQLPARAYSLLGPAVFQPHNRPSSPSEKEAEALFMLWLEDLGDNWREWFPGSHHFVANVLKLAKGASLSQPLEEPVVPNRDLPPPESVPFIPEILVVEDNLVNQKILCKNLEQGGYRYRCAENGILGVEQFRLQAPDVILMDLNMPELDGYGATAEIRNMGHPTSPTVPIIALTATTHPSDLERCLRFGMNAAITKPARRAALFDLLTKWGAPPPNSL